MIVIRAAANLICPRWHSLALSQISTRLQRFKRAVPYREILDFDPSGSYFGTIVVVKIRL
jgi:hypothetical protein